MEKLREHVVPHGMRLAKKGVALRAQSGEVDSAEQLEARVVPVRDSEVLGDLALALKAFAAHRGELACHERGTGIIDGMALVHVRGVRELDRDPLVLDLPPLRQPNDS